MTRVKVDHTAALRAMRSIPGNAPEISSTLDGMFGRIPLRNRALEILSQRNHVDGEPEHERLGAEAIVIRAFEANRTLRYQACPSRSPGNLLELHVAAQLFDKGSRRRD